MKILAINRKANFEYHIIESFQAGLVMDAATVKAIRNGKVNLTGTYVVNNRGILNLINLTLNDALGKSWNKTIPVLLNPKERDEIIGKITEKGVSCVPLRFKTVGRWIKVDIAVARGKKNYDKRETIKKRDLDRDIRRSQEY